MKIVFITGSFPPLSCGVGDYSYRLAQTLITSTAIEEVAVITSRGVKKCSLKEKKLKVFPIVSRWTIWNVFKCYTLLLKLKPDIVHIQYPTAYYKTGLLPHILAFFLRIKGIPVLVTIHEFRFSHILRRCSILLFLITCQKLIFTTDDEKDYVTKRFPFFKGKFTTINIGSNITKIAKEIYFNPNIISYFGLFHHSKNIEKIIDAFKLLSTINHDVRLRLIGSISPRDIHYFEKIKKYANKHIGNDKIEWIIDKNFEEVGTYLMESYVCIMFYPDGVSFRRSSFLSTLELGIPCITNMGESTSNKLVDMENVIFASSPIEVVKKIQYLRDNVNARGHIVKNILTLSRCFSWEMISKKHIELYQEEALK